MLNIMQGKSQFLIETQRFKGWQFCEWALIYFTDAIPRWDSIRFNKAP